MMIRLEKLLLDGLDALSGDVSAFLERQYYRYEEHLERKYGIDGMLKLGFIERT